MTRPSCLAAALALSLALAACSSGPPPLIEAEPGREVFADVPIPLGFRTEQVLRDTDAQTVSVIYTGPYLADPGRALRAMGRDLEQNGWTIKSLDAAKINAWLDDDEDDRCYVELRTEGKEKSYLTVRRITR